MSGPIISRFALAIVASLVGAGAAQAQTPPPPAQQSSSDSAQAVRDEVARLRQEFDQVRQQYGTRLADLEQRLAALEAKPKDVAAEQPGPPAPQSPTAAAATPASPTGAAPAAAPVTASAEKPVTPPAPETPGPVAPQSPTEAAAQAPVAPAAPSAPDAPAGQLPTYGNISAASKVFNPDMAVIGNFLGAAGKNIVEPSPALEMSEAEASFQAVVDPYAKADFFLTFGPEGAGIEEGYLTFTSLPGGLLVKVGKMRSAFGKVNQMHSHVLPWTDRPLVTRNLVGGEDGVSDSGISVSKLILNPIMFLEATGEVYGGSSNVFSAPSRGDLTYVGHLRGYRDLTEGTNLDLGTSVAYGHNSTGPDEITRLIGVDATFRYRPLRRAIYKRFTGRTELIWSRQEQPSPDFTAKSFGYYASGEYQFARRWFSNIRWDWSERASDSALHDHGPAFVMTYWPSEFSQVRGEYRRTSYAEGVVANEFLFQFLFSIGAHGAHTF
jgi:hypothetical protein